MAPDGGGSLAIASPGFSKKKKYGAASSLISNEAGVLRTSSREDLAGDKARGFCSGFMGTFPLWGLLELASGRQQLHLHATGDGGWVEVNAVAADKQDDIYCKPGIVTAGM